MPSLIFSYTEPDGSLLLLGFSEPVWKLLFDISIRRATSLGFFEASNTWLWAFPHEAVFNGLHGMPASPLCGPSSLADTKSRETAAEVEMVAVVWAAEKGGTFLKGLP